MEMNMGQSVLTFDYNDEGIRPSKKVNSVEHIYTLNGAQIVSETIGNVLLVYLYDESGAPIGLQYRNMLKSTRLDISFHKGDICV